VSPGPILITTDLDRTLIFSPRATRELGGALPSDVVEVSGSQTAGELSHKARDAIGALPGHVRVCPATSRSIRRLARLRLPFRYGYAIAANGGVVLVDGVPDPEWSERIRRELTEAAPAAAVRALLAGFAGSPWLERLGEDDEFCCVAIVDREKLDAARFDAISARCQDLGWRASLVGRKLYIFPAGFGKKRAAAFVAERIAGRAGAMPRWLAAGDTEHDLPMLLAADRAWVPAGSDLARRDLAGIQVTRLPGHAAAAQITSEWLAACRS
jgi:hypothetical protein